MSKGKYVLPVILGQHGRELFFVSGEIPKGQGLILVRKSGERGLTDKDVRYMERLLDGEGSSVPRPNRVKELEAITPANIGAFSVREATLVHGYITNVLPGAFKVPELNNWYIFERPGELTPLKLARFAINLLDRSERNVLVELLDKVKVPFNHPQFEGFR